MTPSTTCAPVSGEIHQSARRPSPKTETVTADQLRRGDKIAGGGWSTLRHVILIENGVWLLRDPDSVYGPPILYRVPARTKFERLVGQPREDYPMDSAYPELHITAKDGRVLEVFRRRDTLYGVRTGWGWRVRRSGKVISTNGQALPRYRAIRQAMDAAGPGARITAR